MYITPFWTIGVASRVYGGVPLLSPEPRWIIQAAFRFETFDVLIWSSDE